MKLYVRISAVGNCKIDPTLVNSAPPNNLMSVMLGQTPALGPPPSQNMAMGWTGGYNNPAFVAATTNTPGSPGIKFYREGRTVPFNVRVARISLAERWGIWQWNAGQDAANFLSMFNADAEAGLTGKDSVVLGASVYGTGLTSVRGQYPFVLNVTPGSSSVVTFDQQSKFVNGPWDVVRSAVSYPGTQGTMNGIQAFAPTMLDKRIFSSQQWTDPNFLASRTNWGTSWYIRLISAHCYYLEIDIDDSYASAVADPLKGTYMYVPTTYNTLDRVTYNSSNM